MSWPEAPGGEDEECESIGTEVSEIKEGEWGAESELDGTEIETESELETELDGKWGIGSSESEMGLGITVLWRKGRD